MSSANFKVLTLSVLSSLTVLSGCSTVSGTTEPQTPDQYNQKIKFLTDYSPSQSYARNIVSLMFEDINAFHFDDQQPISDNDDSDYSGYLSPTEATKSWGFEKVQPQVIKHVNNDKGAISEGLAGEASLFNMEGNASTGLALWLLSKVTDQSSSSTEVIKPRHDPGFDYLSDQILVFLPKASYDTEADAENFLYEQMRTALEKGGNQVIKSGVTVTVDRGCERTKITGTLNDAKKSTWLELYLARLDNSDVVPKCEKSIHLRGEQVKSMPIYLKNRDGGFFDFGMAWTFSRKGDSHLFVKGQGARILTAAAKYFPDRTYVYIAPRQKNGTLVAPYLLDRHGTHKFGAPAHSTIPSWYGWMTEKWPMPQS